MNTANPARRSHRRRRGFVVLIVLIVIVMLTYAGLAFVLNLSTENQAAHLRGDELQLDMALASGEELVRAVTALPAMERQSLGGLRDNPQTFQGIPLAAQAAENPLGQFSVVSPRVEDNAIAGYRFGLQNESAKLNLAILPEWERSQPGSAREALLGMPGMTEAIADALLDWMDNDLTPREAGAEAELYASRGVPYGPRNGIPVALEELLLVRDVGRGPLFGGDIDRNYTLDDWEQQQAAEGLANLAGQLPWAALLTLYSGERNRTAAGEPRIALNGEDLQALHASLAEAFNQELADFIAAYRLYGPLPKDPPLAADRGFPRAAGSGARPGSRQDARLGSQRAGSQRSVVQLDLNQPASFRIESVYDLFDAAVELPAAEPSARAKRVPRRRSRTKPRGTSAEPEPPEAPEPIVLRSPLTADGAEMRDLLPQLLDRTTVIEAAVVRGRINVYEAPRTVLMCVPELDQAVLERVVAVRNAYLDGTDLSHRHLTWLLEERILDAAQMRIAERYLTGAGDVFRGQIVASLDGSQLTARAEFVIDATVDPPRRVYWKDLRLLGPGFDSGVFGDPDAIR